MSNDRTTADVTEAMKQTPPGSASGRLDADRMVHEGEDQARRQQETVDGLNNRKPGGSR